MSNEVNNYKYCQQLDKSSDTYKQSTPANIATDMVNMIPDSAFSANARFMDIYCKSASILVAVKRRLFNSQALSGLEPTKRLKHILAHQIYAICPNDDALRQCKLNIYGNALIDEIEDEHGIKHKVGIRLLENLESIVKDTDEYIKTIGSLFSDIFSKETDKVKFNIVVGNPPYNKDIYLDFVRQGHKLATDYSLWITPAKWQAKGGGGKRHLP